MNTRTQALVALACVAVSCLVVVTACGSSDPAPTISQQPSSPSSPSSPSATMSPKRLTPQESAIKAGENMVHVFFRESDRSLFDPKKTPSDFFKATTIGSELANQENSLDAAKAQAVKQIGYTKVVSITNPKVDLRNKPKLTPPLIPGVIFDVCYDVSKVNIVDAAGKSVVPAERLPRGVMSVGVSNYSYPNPTGWRVDFTEVKKNKKC